MFILLILYAKEIKVFLIAFLLMPLKWIQNIKCDIKNLGWYKRGQHWIQILISVYLSYVFISVVSYICVSPFNKYVIKGGINLKCWWIINLSLYIGYKSYIFFIPLKLLYWWRYKILNINGVKNWFLPFSSDFYR